jgi:RHS repeat-associated protein
LDNTGLYYYNARYYDPGIGRFISADTIVPNPANPQSLNRYSYCLNNPLKYTDPTGHMDDYDLGLDIPDDYGDYVDAYNSGFETSYTGWKNSGSPTVFINALSPDHPDLPCSIRVNEPFRVVIPTASGRVEATIRYGWEDECLTVDIISCTIIENGQDPNNCTVQGSIGAIIKVEDKEYQIDLKQPDHPVLRPPDSLSQEGQTTIYSIHEGEQVTLTIMIGVAVNGSIDQPGSSLVTIPTGGSWTYTIYR